MKRQTEWEGTTTEELLRLYKQNNELSLKQEIVLRYTYLVRSIAAQMKDIYMSFAQIDDIINEGVIVIMNAVDRFDPEKNVKFETYISKRIKGMIIDMARKQDWVPRSTRKIAKEIEEAVGELYNRLGYYPSSKEVADYLHISIEKYEEYAKKASLFNILSLDMVLAETQENWGVVKAPHGREERSPEEQFIKREATEILAEGIRTLKENEQQVISLYYMEELNMRQIASVLGVSEPRISQIHSNAMKKMKSYMQKINEEKEKKYVSGIL